MITYSRVFDQQTMTLMLEHDPVVQRYRAFFRLFNWSVVPEPAINPTHPGKRPHPQCAYIKALLVKLEENLTSCTRLRRYLLEHPLLVLELGFRPVLDISQPYGFNLERTVPTARWLREKQRTLEQSVLQALLMETVYALCEEIPGLGEVVAFDVTHIYAWVRENNPRVYVKGTFDVTHIPKGDPDCRLGVKKSTNQEQPDGTKKEKKKAFSATARELRPAPIPSMAMLCSRSIHNPLTKAISPILSRSTYGPWQHWASFLPTSPLTPPLMPGTSIRPSFTAMALPPSRSTSTVIPRVGAMSMACPCVTKVCGCTPPTSFPTLTAIAHNVFAAPCSFPKKRTKPVIMLNLSKEKAALRTSIGNWEGRCG